MTKEERRRAYVEWALVHEIPSAALLRFSTMGMKGWFGAHDNSQLFVPAPVKEARMRAQKGLLRGPFAAG